ncbi:LexA family protein [Phyllobacterium sp. K27]
MTDTTLWAVNIHGPDDLIAVPDYVTAIKIAMPFNYWWLKRVQADYHEYDPRMWAVPVEWPHSPDSHAEALASENSEYQWLFDVVAKADAVAKPRMSLLPTHIKALEFITRRLAAGETAPSVGEMAKELGLSSRSGAHRIIVALEERGHIVRMHGRSRCIQLVQP